MASVYEEIFERSPVAMLLVSIEGDILLASGHVERLFGYSRSELLAKQLADLVPDAQLALPATAAAGRIAPNHMGPGKSLTGHRKDRSQFAVEVALSRIEQDGQPNVLVSILDITERTRSEERFRSAVEAAPNGMLMVNDRQVIVLCNREVERIFGYAPNELLDQPVATLIPNGLRSAHGTYVSAYLKNPEARAMGLGRELYGRHKSGRLVPVEIGLQPIEADGHIFVISSVVDITSRQQAEAEIRSKTEELEAFAYRTSHDLRSPLMSIISMAECIQEDIDEQDFEQARLGADRASSLAQRLLKLVEDILTLTQVGSEANDVEQIDFDDYQQAITAAIAMEVSRQDVDVEFAFEHEHQLLSQSIRLRQILDNLIFNAVKYSDPKKPGRRLIVRTRSRDDRFVIEVEDNGLGIPSQRQKDVFGMFQRFHTSDSPGSGLGLYIASKQAEKLQGKITFESSEQGTTFRVDLPQTPAPKPKPR